MGSCDPKYNLSNFVKVFKQIVKQNKWRVLKITLLSCQPRVTVTSCFLIVDGHGCHTALHFGVKAKENQDKVPTLYWLPKLHKKPYKARFIANSSSCTTTELSKLLTSCLTAVKKTCYQIL